jgi:uracil-DNA glycosylase
MHHCTRCALHLGRTHVVMGEGSWPCHTMIIGEAPGKHEDLEGRPFIGRSGQLLDRLLTHVNLQRHECYVTNLVKCRPERNRNPNASEVNTCRIFLDEEFKRVTPKRLLILGKVASFFMLNNTIPMHVLRQTLHTVLNIPTMVTYHPAYALRNPAIITTMQIDIARFASLKIY